MKGNAKVQEFIDKHTGQKRYTITIPAAIVKALEIKKGNRIDIEIGNSIPDYIEASTSGNNFKPKEEGT